MIGRGTFCGLLVFAVSSFAWTDADEKNGIETLRTALSGANEIPANLSTGTGDASLKVTEAPASVSVTIRYSNLTGNAAAAHLHLGNRWENGPVVVTICGNSERACPAQGMEQTFTFALTGNAINAVPTPTLYG